MCFIKSDLRFIKSDLRFIKPDLRFISPKIRRNSLTRRHFLIRPEIYPEFP